MEGQSTNAVLRHHQLRHVPFLGEPARLAQQDTPRAKRTDLRIVGPGAAWSPGIFIIPLFSQISEGNQNDSVTFSRVLTI